MAKKERLSKRDRRIKRVLKNQEILNFMLDDDDFRGRFFLSIQDIDPSFSGEIILVGNDVKYVFFDGEEITSEFNIAYVTNDGAFVYSKPFSNNEVPL